MIWIIVAVVVFIIFLIIAYNNDFDSIDGGKSYILYVPTGTITNTVNLE